MKKYIKLITCASIIIALALLTSGVSVQAHDHSKTNKVDRVKSKTKPTGKKPNPTEARRAYAAAAKKIKEAVEAGKLTKEEAKKKYAELRKKMATARTSRADIIKRFDKNKDGKLDEKERAEARKAMSSRSKRPEREGKKRSRRGDKRKDKSSRRNRK